MMNPEFQYDVFLSHNNADKPNVRRLAERLRDSGLRVWFDEWIIKPGDDIYLAVERGLEASRTLVLCLSPTALASGWVGLERSTVMFRDPVNLSRRFIPIVLSDCQLPDALRRYKYVDYRKGIQAAFDQLLAGCRPQEQPKAAPVAPQPSFLSRLIPWRKTDEREQEQQLRPEEQEEQWRRADAEVRFQLPPGVKLVRTLRGHTAAIGRIAWSPDGGMLASASEDKTARLWNAESGELVRTLKGHTGWVYAVAWASDGQRLASASADHTIRIWNAEHGDLLQTLEGHQAEVFTVSWAPGGPSVASGSRDGEIILWNVESGKELKRVCNAGYWVNSVAFSPDGCHVASGTGEGVVELWDPETGRVRQVLRKHSLYVVGVAWAADGRAVASASYDDTVRIWNTLAGSEVAVLEGHTAPVNCVSYSADARLLASKSADGTVRLWSSDPWKTVAIVRESLDLGRLASGSVYDERELTRNWPAGLAFHPHLPLLATVGSEPGAGQDQRERVIHIYELDVPFLLGQVAESTVQYINAKIVLVGDTGVGKSGLSLVLNDEQFVATDSTPGRRVYTLGSQEVRVSANIMQIRETLLWDLAGQPGYRIIHQLHLNEVAVALVVFDARSETDPLAGVRHWERALRLAQQRQGTSAVPMKKFLVSARNDRGGVSIGEDRVQKILDEFGFGKYFKTSAKEGWEISELRTAIEKAIDWGRLPKVSSSHLFADIKSFLLEVKKTGRLLAPASQLCDEFAREHHATPGKVASLRDQFDTCIGRLENRDLVRRLTFGGYVLLQPELLDAYGSAMVNTARDEPDGLGSLAEEIALAGKFFVPKEQKVADLGQEQLLLHATVEELVRHDLALREHADDGRFLVFPSQFNRDFEDAPEPKGKAVAIAFHGSVQSLYTTLAVRLGHSGMFTTGRAEMWRNAAVFTAKAGGRCGLFLHEFAEGRGRLTLFYPDEHSSAETRFHFEEFVLAHARRRALDGTVELVRFFVCADCGDPVPDNYVKRLEKRGKMEFNCPCGGRVSLTEPKERIHFRSKIGAMEQSANRQRDFDAFVVSAKGETSTKSFRDWAGGEQVTLAIVFTDVVASTALGEAIRDEAMNEVRRAHFAQSRRLIGQFRGREIKTIGDSFMTAFRCAGEALDYARALQANGGHPEVQIRVGIHIGPMRIEEGDVFGGTVNFAARVIGAVQSAEIWLSERAKEDIDRLGASKHRGLKWERHDGVAMKGFSGTFTLWAVVG